MADENELGQKTGGRESSGKRPLESLVLLLNTIMMMVVAWFQYDIHKNFNSKVDLEDVVKADMQKGESGGALPGEAVGDIGILFPLDSFTANLAQGDGPRRFIRLNTVLKFSGRSNEEEFKARKPQIRDAIINTLNVKRPEDILDLKGKIRLKEDLKAAINTFLIDGEVTDIYYVGFQIN
ncbi:MAG: flagellar basal body-associated FliL family protein [Halobacteriovoraceae bacterium]|nr:flagellar basal body-associated FliL family protein [Halobacteriovoraceae bacterium]